MQNYYYLSIIIEKYMILLVGKTLILLDMDMKTEKIGYIFGFSIVSFL